MQKESSPTSSNGLQPTAATTVAGSDTTNTKSSSNATAAASQQHYFSVTRNPFLSPAPERPNSEAYFYSSSLLSEDSNLPPDASLDETMADNFATERRLRQASFVLEYQQLYNYYTLCLSHLQELIKEVDSFRQENDALRMANADLAQRLNLLSQATIQDCLLSDLNHLNIGKDASSLHIIANPKSLIERGRVYRPEPVERVSLPKSISVRSCGYMKMKAHGGINSGDQTQCSTRSRLNSLYHPRPQRVYVPGGEREKAAAEFEVYNQGMVKTELCNKWQETGTCPYTENCQFAHGIKELRPVIRHPRYKTEVCRMVLAGDICPYGHRCHFRHTLTDQGKLIAPQYSHANAT